VRPLRDRKIPASLEASQPHAQHCGFVVHGSVGSQFLTAGNLHSSSTGSTVDYRNPAELNLFEPKQSGVKLAKFFGMFCVRKRINVSPVFHNLRAVFFGLSASKLGLIPIANRFIPFIYAQADLGLLSRKANFKHDRIFSTKEASPSIGRAAFGRWVMSLHGPAAHLFT